jgi:hypothetical protein
MAKKFYVVIFGEPKAKNKKSAIRKPEERAPGIDAEVALENEAEEEFFEETGVAPDDLEDKMITADLGAEVLAFDGKREIDRFLQTRLVRPHSKDYLAGKCILQLGDGRACIVLHGILRALRAIHTVAL